ncbi:hypothetical protein FA15DRAFT_604255, partial [Coprinopsis marcescibilis]
QKRLFSKEAFINSIVSWVVADDQSLNVIESQYLREIFLMLRSELKDKDIPHRSQIRDRVIETWGAHVEHLKGHIKVSFFVYYLMAFVNQIGWINMDNASNNHRFMVLLAIELEGRDIEFDSDERQIR